MIQKTGVALRFYAFYVASKLGATGLSVTCTVYENGVSIVSGAAATEIGGGLYSYTLAGASNDANGEYAAIFHTTTTTVDAQDVPALWTTPAWLSELGSATVTFTNPVASDGAISLVRGDDYYAADGRSLDFTFTSFPSFVGAAPVTLTLRNRNTGVEDLTITGSALGATQLRFELTSAQTANLVVGTSAYDFDIQVTLSNGHKVTVNIGSATVLEDFS